MEIFTILITVSTVLVSVACFNNRGLFSRLSFRPFEISENKQFDRFITHTFVHSDWVHLIVNMLVFFSFGGFVEGKFIEMEAANKLFSGRLVFVLLYFGGGILASLSSYLKHRENPYYVSVGASGAVSAVVFTSIFYNPRSNIYFYGILPIPGILFGILYLVYSSYMSKKGKDNINHDAHFWGAVYGFLLPVLIEPASALEFLNRLFA